MAGDYRNHHEPNELKDAIPHHERKAAKLEEDVTELKRRARFANTINDVEGMKIVLHHLAKFIFPSTEKIGSGIFLKEMLSEIEENPALDKIWQELLHHCGVKSWTRRHTNVHKSLIQSWNTNNAHDKDFDFESLLAMMLEGKPNHGVECEDILRMFKKVDHLMKFGIISTELLENMEEFDEFKKSIKLMHRTKIWDKSDVQNFQNIKLIEAEEHVAQYFPDVRASGIWSKTISLILDTNRPRF